MNGTGIYGHMSLALCINGFVTFVLHDFISVSCTQTKSVIYYIETMLLYLSSTLKRFSCENCDLSIKWKIDEEKWIDVKKQNIQRKNSMAVVKEI